MTAAFDALAAPRRRYLLSILSERRAPSSLETLATDVAVREHRSPIVTDEQAETVHVELVHNHVPRLLEAGLLIEVTDEGTRAVALADHPLFETDWVQSLLAEPTGGPDRDEAQLNRTLEALRPARRRSVCDVLARHPNGLAVADLAATLVARDEDVRLVDVDESARRPIETRLVHDDLPTLEGAGLVDYDRSSDTVALETDAPQWHAEWLAAGPLGDVAAVLTATDDDPASGDGEGGADIATDDSTGGGAYRTLEGATAITERCHELTADADEELFVTIPDAGLLSRRCLEGLRDAVDRGVDVYVGSRSPRVRDTVRSAVPGATICEPQCDWLNFPVGRVHHGHVVFADRERVLLATLDERSETDDGAPDGGRDATAITGVGAENTLVRLVREHVGPRLDRLQSRRDDDRSDEESTPLPL